MKRVPLPLWASLAIASTACSSARPVPTAPSPHPTVAHADPIPNLTAFTTLFGDIRFFHPSDEAANADWEKFAVDAVPRVEHAGSPEELAGVLQDLFYPVAPTVRIHVAGAAPPLPASLLAPAEAGPATYVGWVHYGVKLDEPQPIYARVRASNHATPRSAPSELHARITEGAVRGHAVHVHASVRAELTDPHASAIVALEAWIPHVGIRDIASAAVTSTHWSEVDFTGDMPDADLMQVHLGLRLTGAGRAWLDDVSTSVGNTPVVLDDADFEHATEGKLPAGWFNDDHTATASALNPHAGKLCAQIDAPPLPLEPLPTPEQTLHVSLGAGVDAEIPLTLYVDATGHTLPRGEVPPAPSEPREARLARYSATDRAVRLADIALAWTVFEHFFPYFDVVQVDWHAELRRALARAMDDTDAASFQKTLKRLIATLHDNHAYVTTDEKVVPLKAAMPLGLKVVEGKLVVTATGKDAGDVHVGDVVEAIDGVPTERALVAKGELISAATPQSLALHEAMDLDFGPRGGEALLSLRRPDGQSVARRLA